MLLAHASVIVDIACVAVGHVITKPTAHRSELLALAIELATPSE